MAAPITITRPLAGLLIRSLAGYLDNAKAAGREVPELSWKYLDGLSRGDAQALYAWGMQQPQLHAALRNTAHPDHTAVRSYLALANHFMTDHPQKSDGEPADWTEPLSPAMHSYLIGASDDIPIAELPPGEATAFLAHAETRGDLMAAYYDGTAENHQGIRDAMVALQARAAETTAVSEPGQEGHAGQPDTAAASRIPELQAALRDHGPERLQGSDRAATTAELMSLLAKAPEGAVTKMPVVKPAAGASRVDQLNAALRDQSANRLQGSDRAAAVAELSGLLTASPASLGDDSGDAVGAGAP